MVQTAECKMNPKALQILILCITLAITLEDSDELNEECIVTHNIDHAINSKGEIKGIVYLSRETDLKIYVAYVDREEQSDYDMVHIQMNNTYREKHRNRKLNGTEDINSNIPLSLGWSNFSVKIENKLMEIIVNSQLFTTIKFDYLVRHLSVVSGNIAKCSKGKPKWKISEGDPTPIPIDGQDSIHFSLISNKPFTPILYINHRPFHLHYNNGVELGYDDSSLLLQNGTYDLVLEIETQRFILYFKQLGNEYDPIINIKMAEQLVDMNVGSLHEIFFLELSPTRSEKIKIQASSQTPIIVCSVIIVLLVLVIAFLLFKLKKMSNEAQPKTEIKINEGEDSNLVKNTESTVSQSKTDEGKFLKLDLQTSEDTESKV